MNARCSGGKGERMSIETIEREASQSMPARVATPLRTLLLRFVGLLFLAVTALALVWSS
jgi:hypothetical protein